MTRAFPLPLLALAVMFICTGRAEAIAPGIEALGRETLFIMPLHAPSDPRFDSKRYWRDPVWLVVNYMIACGLADAGESAVAERITRSNLKLVTESGFAECYDPT